MKDVKQETQLNKNKHIFLAIMPALHWNSTLIQCRSKPHLKVVFFL